MKEGDFMNINKFTQKSVEALQLCEKLANDYGNSEIDQEHLAYALVSLDESDLGATVEIDVYEVEEDIIEFVHYPKNGEAVDVTVI